MTNRSRVITCDHQGNNIGDYIRPMYVRNFGLEVALDRVLGYDTVNKFGKAPIVAAGIRDIWDLAATQPIWVPPTQPRVHFLASTNANDTAAGTGVQEVRISGLVTFGSTEISETREMNGLTDVGTFAYAVIHRIEAIRWGSAGVAQGLITATADVDGTVTAAILAGGNRTNMMIYGIPSTQKLKIARFTSQMIKSTGGILSADGQVLVMPDPVTYAPANTAWVPIEQFLVTNNSPPWEHDYDPIFKGFPEPFIIKMQVEMSGGGDVSVYGNMDAFRVNV